MKHFTARLIAIFLLSLTSIAAQASEVSLFGVPLINAPRMELDRAIIDAGGKRLKSKSANVAVFDIKALNLPGLKKLEIVYNAAQRFVLARYTGLYGLHSDDALRLIGMLEKKYGQQKSKKQGFNQSFEWMSGDIRIQLQDQHMRDTELKYVDVEAMVALKRAIDRQESQFIEKNAVSKSNYF